MQCSICILCSNLVTEKYEVSVYKLIEDFYLPEENGQSGAKNRIAVENKLKYIKRLAKEDRLAEELEGTEFTPEFLAWIKKELINKYTCKSTDNSEKEALTLYNLSCLGKRQKSIESVFYNIIYCVLLHYGFHYQREIRKEPLKFHVFCNITGNNHKTLSRKGTIHYTKEDITRIWRCDKDSFLEGKKEEWTLLQDIIIDIAEEIAKYFNKE